VLLGPQAPTAYLAALAARLPVVVVARAVRHRAVDVVRTDDAAGLEQAVDHLVELGHRRIAHIDGGRAPGAAERRRGYTGELHRHGLGRNALIVPGGLTEDDGAGAARALLELSDPRAPTAHRLQRPVRDGRAGRPARRGRGGPARTRQPDRSHPGSRAGTQVTTLV
jgi:DNA-binding LacI/PurR family transcriptional regulator